MEVQKEQETRWRKFLYKWSSISRNTKCIVLGDINLDHLRWSNPEPHLDNMVEDMKNLIETSGFTQIILGLTRSWRGQSDSLLDQICTNCSQRTIKSFNIDRSSSDHNVDGMEISTKDIIVGGPNVWKTCWKEFNKQCCLDSFRQIDWSDILAQTYISLANSQLEDIICEIMDREAPMKLVQVRSKYRSWVSSETKLEMDKRDKARTLARDSDRDEDWADYMCLRNICTKN